MSKTRAVAYVRVSTEKQADAGHSLEAQQAKLSAYASLYELELVEVVVDAGVSAKTLNRPGLQRALAMVEGFVSERGAALLSVSEQIDTRSAAGRLVLNVLASVSQWEREAIGERTAAVMRHKAEQGEYTGGQVPYGYRLVEGALVEVEAEQAVLSAAREAKRAGLTLRAIARELEARGLLSRTGRPFAPQVARMLA
jgi:site-specific DNA recombinase